MCECNDYPPKFSEVVNVKAARKAHQCSECLRVIKPGEPYKRVSGVWEDDFDVIKTCRLCLEFIDKAGIRCYCYGMLMEDIDERDGPLEAEFLQRRRRNWERLRFENIFKGVFKGVFKR